MCSIAYWPCQRKCVVNDICHTLSNVWHVFDVGRGNGIVRRMKRKIWDFKDFCGNSDANQRCSAQTLASPSGSASPNLPSVSLRCIPASQKAPPIFRASISASPSHFNLRLCRSFHGCQGKFRANRALALGAKPVRRSVSGATLKPSEFDR